MNSYLFLRFLHLISAVVFLGGIFARQLVRTLAKQTDNVHVLATLSCAAGHIEKCTTIPGHSAVILFGILLALQMQAPIFGFLQGAAQNWLLASNLLLAIGFWPVLLVFLPRGKKFDAALQQAVAEGHITPALRAALDDKLIRALHIGETGGVGLTMCLMVLKPF
jgi:uncharacterized membrane protein